MEVLIEATKISNAEAGQGTRSSNEDEVFPNLQLFTSFCNGYFNETLFIFSCQDKSTAIR